MKSAYLWTYLLDIPLWSILAMLPFIALRELQATQWQLTLMLTLYSAVSIFSPYWSDFVNKRRDRLVSNVVLGGVLGHLPFLFFPFTTNIYWYIASYALYMFFYRSVTPAWMELLKIYAEPGIRERIVAYVLSLSYLITPLFACLIGWMLDEYPLYWREIYAVTAAISLLSTTVQLQMQREPKNGESTEAICLYRPWKNMWELLKKRSDYRTFQIGFMLGGAGLMILQTARAEIFMNVLELNYLELTFAISLCKGVGFAFASGLWASFLSRVNIFRFSSLVVFLFSLYPLGLLAAKAHILILFAVCLLYGVSQAGSEIVWKLSGPLFSRSEDSSLYTSVNVFTVGLRGCITNPIGGLLLFAFGPAAVMGVAFLLCLFASAHLFLASRKTGELIAAA